jgi:hypothetical protein
MPRSMTKDEAQAFRACWERVNAREIEELRTTSLEIRWQQFNTLLSWAKELDWSADLAKEEDQVRKRWARLRKEFLSNRHL